MKAFIVLALVACVAARSVDVDTLRLLSKEKSLLSRDDWLLKDRFDTHRFSPKKGLLKSFDYPTPSTYFGDDDYEPYQHRVTIIPFEEIVSYPLFREYLEIPLFRQFLEQYPTVFRRYVESPFFQKFWTVPQFQTYFRNPVFFYKYIVPQVQIFAKYPYHQRYPSYGPYTPEGTYDRSTGYNYDVQDYFNTPRPSGFNRHAVSVEDYLNRIYGHGIERPSYPYGYRHGYPDFSTEDRYTTPFFGGRRVNHKYLLDKIYRNLFVNQPTVGEVTQVRTDVEIAPAQKEVIVEPRTGESKVIYEPSRIVDVKVDEKVVPVSEYPTVHTTDVERNVVVKETLLKRLLITKRITPELFTILRTLPLHHVRELLKRIVPSVDVESTFGDDVSYPSGYDVEDYKNVDFNDVYRHKINQIVNRLYNHETVGDRYTPVARDLLNVLGHHTIRDVPEFVRA